MGRVVGKIDACFAAVSACARWKKRARPVIRRVIFSACASLSLNAAFSSLANS